MWNVQRRVWFSWETLLTVETRDIALNYAIVYKAAHGGKIRIRPAV